MFRKIQFLKISEKKIKTCIVRAWFEIFEKYTMNKKIQER